MINIEVYADGSCKPTHNGYVAGSGIYIKKCKFMEKDIKLISKVPHKQTSQRAEIYAVVVSLDYISKNILNKFNNDQKYLIHIFTDSMYVIKCAQKIFNRIKNRDLFDMYDKLAKNKNIKFSHVKGHTGVLGNEIADQLANKCVDRIISN